MMQEQRLKCMLKLGCRFMRSYKGERERVATIDAGASETSYWEGDRTGEIMAECRVIKRSPPILVLIHRLIDSAALLCVV